MVSRWTSAIVQVRAAAERDFVAGICSSGALLRCGALLAAREDPQLLRHVRARADESSQC